MRNCDREKESDRATLTQRETESEQQKETEQTDRVSGRKRDGENGRGRDCESRQTDRKNKCEREREDTYFLI